jgi:hypothetical protein
MNLQSELFQAAALVGVTHLVAEFLDNSTLKTLDENPGTEAALAVAAVLLPSLSGGAGGAGAAGAPASSAPALVEEYALVEEAGAAATSSAPALVEEYALVEAAGAAGTSVPSLPAPVGGYGGLTALAAVMGFLMGQHRAERGRSKARVVDVELEEVVEVEEYEDRDDDDDGRRREYRDDDDDRRRREHRDDDDDDGRRPRGERGSA